MPYLFWGAFLSLNLVGFLPKIVSAQSVQNQPLVLLDQAVVEDFRKLYELRQRLRALRGLLVEFQRLIVEKTAERAEHGWLEFWDKADLDQSITDLEENQRFQQSQLTTLQDEQRELLETIYGRLNTLLAGKIISREEFFKIFVDDEKRSANLSAGYNDPISSLDIATAATGACLRNACPDRVILHAGQGVYGVGRGACNLTKETVLLIPDGLVSVGELVTDMPEDWYHSSLGKSLKVNGLEQTVCMIPHGLYESTIGNFKKAVKSGDMSYMGEGIFNGGILAYPVAEGGSALANVLRNSRLSWREVMVTTGIAVSEAMPNAGRPAFMSGAGSAFMVGKSYLLPTLELPLSSTAATAPFLLLDTVSAQALTTSLVAAAVGSPSTPPPPSMHDPKNKSGVKEIDDFIALLEKQQPGIRAKLRRAFKSGDKKFWKEVQQHLRGSRRSGQTLADWNESIISRLRAGIEVPESEFFAFAARSSPTGLDAAVFAFERGITEVAPASGGTLASRLLQMIDTPGELLRGHTFWKTFHLAEAERWIRRLDNLEGLKAAGVDRLAELRSALEAVPSEAWWRRMSLKDYLQRARARRVLSDIQELAQTLKIARLAEGTPAEQAAAVAAKLVELHPSQMFGAELAATGSKTLSAGMLYWFIMDILEEVEDGDLENRERAQAFKQTLGGVDPVTASNADKIQGLQNYLQRFGAMSNPQMSVDYCHGMLAKIQQQAVNTTLTPEQRHERLAFAKIIELTIEQIDALEDDPEIEDQLEAQTILWRGLREQLIAQGLIQATDSPFPDDDLEPDLYDYEDWSPPSDE